METNSYIVGSIADPAGDARMGRPTESELFPLSELFSGEADNEGPVSLEPEGGSPEKILVINCGSSSLKYHFYDTAKKSRQTHGVIERIGLEGTRLLHSGPKGEVIRALLKGGFVAAFETMIGELTDRNTGVIDAATAVSVVVHRVVHGGEKFMQGTLIEGNVLAQIEALNPLAPLHNPVNVAGIREMRRLFPAARHVAVFDTAFHRTLPACAYLYGLPYEFYERNSVRRYGFHGISHHCVVLRSARFLRRRPDELRLVSCHLGNGASLCAINRGRSVDTTMGFTPAEGLIMGTRCGDIDAGALTFLARTEGLTAPQVEDLLNRQSGLLGLSGISSDMREILKAADEGRPRAVLALEAYCYRVRKYLGAYTAILGGLDTVAFTGGVGEGSAEVRSRVLQDLECLGIQLDEQRNRSAHGGKAVRCISAHGSPVTVLVVPSEEEGMMAREALQVLNRSRAPQLSALPLPPDTEVKPAIQR